MLGVVHKTEQMWWVAIDDGSLAGAMVSSNDGVIVEGS